MFMFVSGVIVLPTKTTQYHDKIIHQLPYPETVWSCWSSQDWLFYYPCFDSLPCFKKTDHPPDVKFLLPRELGQGGPRPLKDLSGWSKKSWHRIPYNEPIYIYIYIASIYTRYMIYVMFIISFCAQCFLKINHMICSMLEILHKCVYQLENHTVIETYYCIVHKKIHNVFIKCPIFFECSSSIITV